MNKVSVIIPIYNTEKYLKSCIESIINQTYKDLEIILVNDGSKDNSDTICKEYAKKDNRINYVQKENGGVSSARNMGIDIATGNYIVFIDSDDKIDLNAIQELINHKEENSLIGLKIIRNTYFDTYTTEELISSILENKALGSSCGYLFDRKKIGDLRFDTNTYYMEDTLFLINYLVNVKIIKFVSQAKYIYTENNNSVTKVVSLKKTEENIKNLFYSLEQIRNLIEKKYTLECNKLVENKKVKLIESELIKFDKLKKIKEFCTNITIRESLNNCNKKDLAWIYKIIRKMILKNWTFLCYVYSKLRRLMIQLKRR